MKWLAVLLLMVPFAGESSAQSNPADSAACARGDSARAVIRLEASVRAESLRLDAPAQARAAVRSCAPGSGVRVQRQNLPDRVQPGVTYRDAGVRVLITADPVLACRLTAALSTPAGQAPPPDTLCAGAAPPAPAPPAARPPGD
ncbi:MAG TPA: hypothetical protein VF710_05990 [Longimicrobium sp.]